MSVLRTYRKLLGYPKSVLVVVFCLALTATWHIRNFTFDASSDTLVVQGDPKLSTYFKMTELFGGDEFLVLTYSRQEQGTLFSEESLAQLNALQAELKSLQGVRGVFSILDAPLVKSPPVAIDAMSENYKTLRSPDVDKSLAKIELTNSALFNDFLISSDGESSVIRVDLEREYKLEELRRQRDAARRSPANPISDQLVTLEAELRIARKEYVGRRERLIERVREIRNRYSQDASIFISGVPMIAADMISYVKSDLLMFGSLVLISIVASLFFFFRHGRWVTLPILISGISILLTMGVLGFMQKPVTVVSSNFISLLAIISISFSIHLIVRYRELLADDPEVGHESLIFGTMQSKFTPCLYTALTTLLAFGSMMGSHIVPVEDFGWMMCLGIILSFLITYMVFPAVLFVLGKTEPSATIKSRIQLTYIFSRYSRQNTGTILIISLILLLIAINGLRLVTFENHFIDYFDDDTDIHTGMAYIDEHLGGTVPFDVYIQFEPYGAVHLDEEDDFFTEPEPYPERYWYTSNKLETIAKLHQLIEQQPNVGKVISLSTLEGITREFNNGLPLTEFELLYILGELPVEIREQLIKPYARPETGFTRINARLKESVELTGAASSQGQSSRDQMILNIEQYAVNELGLSSNQVVVTGMMVLFNDMLKQLAQSQLRTLFYVVAATFLMFSVLLRSITLAVLALIPNVIAASLVIAFMGYAGIPMDMMTITIAAISIGIGVDDAIHYLHRFKEEFAIDHDVNAAIERSHLTIGRAMYFTSIIITIGFSILAFSNFLPTVYFGLLTALAMVLALLANLTILPSLLIQVYHNMGFKFHNVRSG